jgi:Putative porin
MKVVLRWCVVPLLATCLVAQTPMKHKPRKAAAPAAAPAVTLQDVQQLRDALAAQQRQIEQLQQQLSQRDQALQQAAGAATDAQSKAADAAAQAGQQQQAVEALHKDVAELKSSNVNVAQTIQDTQKAITADNKEIKALSKLKLSGDLRLRYEPFFGGGPANGAASPDRHRERFRLRFNVSTKVSDDFDIGFSLASGDLGDPVSTNSTETGFFTRKPFAIDKAFGVYNPHGFKPLKLTVGKFGYTWLRTELTWDNDLNPEGASEQLSWDWKNKFLNHFGIVGYETPIFEVGGGADTYMTGAQVQTGWSLGPSVKFTADVAYYDFDNADTIAQNQTQSPSNGFATQGISNTGGGNFGFSASSLTNNFGVINSKRVFASKYGDVDAIARLDFDTGNKRWPIYALFDFAQNTQACANLKAFVAAGVTPLPTCDPHQRHGYWSELKFGQTKNKGDLLLGYTFARIERDAVLSAFDFSDLRQPTNVVEHRVEAYYQAHAHVQVGVTGLIGRQLVTAQSPTLERWLKRWQFDTIFSF